MTTNEVECQECGRFGTDLEADGFEIHNYPGGGSLRGKKVPLPRCSDRRACERRRKLLVEEVAVEALAEAADALAGLRKDVKDAEAHLASEIKRAVKEKVSPTAIARAARISRERVYQIRDGRR